MKHRLLILIPCLLGIVFWSGAQEDAEEVTSESGPRMKTFFEKFPKADLDKNGILTLDEMHDYLNEKISDGARSDMKGKIVSRAYLRRILKSSPDSDLDKDGVLTKSELLEFVKRKKIQKPGEEKTVAKTV